MLLGAGACSSRSSDLADRLERAAKLEGAKASKLPDLAQAAEQIDASGVGPAGLTVPPGSAETNAAAALNRVLTDADRLKLIPQLEELSTPIDSSYSPAQVQAIRELLKARRSLVKSLEAATALPRCASGVRLDQGFFDRYAFLDDATIAVRMHMIQAAAQLDKRDVSQAIDQAIMAARWIQWLSAERRLDGRLLAASLRGEWFRLLQAITATSVTVDQLQLLFTELRSQLDRWPPDRDSLVGDRAVTMHAYETLRLGLVDRVLTIDEKKRLKEAGLLEKVEAMDNASIDQDELLYLQTMQRIIDVSDQPYFERFEQLVPLFDSLRLGDDTSTAAPLATWLFLPGMPGALEQMARDRALTEGWALVVASAADFDLPPYRVSPLTGGVYQATRDPGGVTMRMNDPQADDPFVKTSGVISGR